MMVYPAEKLNDYTCHQWLFFVTRQFMSHWLRPEARSLKTIVGQIKSNKIKLIFVYLMEKSTTAVTDAKVVYRILLGGQRYIN